MNASELLKKDSENWGNSFLLELEQNLIGDVVFDIQRRFLYYNYSLTKTIHNAKMQIEAATKEVAKWIKHKELVRVIGAGRARLAAAVPANRLHHAGARVYIIHDLIPLPNSYYGGNILAASASGETLEVLEIMKQAKVLNRNIRIIGIASYKAVKFAELCDVFIPIQDSDIPHHNPLKALADTSEQIISELLDAIIVAAASHLGLRDEDYRRGHEDLGPTGPYSLKVNSDKMDSATQKMNLIENSIRLLRPHYIATNLIKQICLINSVSLENCTKIVENLVKNKIINRTRNGYTLSKYSIDTDETNPFNIVELNKNLAKAYEVVAFGSIEFAKEIVYHYLEAFDYDSAYGYMFFNKNVELWLSQGEAIKIIDSLDELLRKIDYFPPLRQATIFVALAEVASSTGEQQKAIDFLKLANSKLPVENTSSETDEIKRRVWRLAAVSCGNMGQIKNAMTIYREAIYMDASCNDPNTALCMGYLAYLYSENQQYEIAQQWVRLAQEGCPEYRNPKIFAKSLCNRAIIEMYMQNFDLSEKLFNEALKISQGNECFGGDKREVGRILCHKGMLLLSRNNDLDINFFDIAIYSCQFCGDKRRELIALALRGIANAKLGNKNKGENDLFTAIVSHYELCDIKNTCFDLIAYLILYSGLTELREVDKVVVPNKLKYVSKVVLIEENTAIIDHWFKRFNEYILCNEIKGELYLNV